MATLIVPYDPDDIQDLLQQEDAAHLAKSLESPTAPLPSHFEAAADRLRVAAQISLVQLLSQVRVDDFLRRAAAGDEQILPLADLQDVFERWSSYLTSLFDAGTEPTSDDLLFFAVSGYIAQQSPAVRTLLRLSAAREALAASTHKIVSEAWVNRVRHTINIAVLCIVRQENHADLLQAKSSIQTLASEQRAIEKVWIAQERVSSHDAFALLGMYHLAQAALRAAEYLTSGSVVTDGVINQDFSSELRRLLVRAEEYILLSGDLELQQWINGLAILLWTLNVDSLVPVQSSGVRRARERAGRRGQDVYSVARTE